MECILRLFRTIPVTLCDTGTGNPNFANAIIRALFERVGVDNYNLLIEQISTTADEFARNGTAVGSCGHAMLFECGAVEALDGGGGRFVAARDDQRRFRHAVAGIE